MNDTDDLTPTEKEIAMLRALRADPSLAEAFEQLARISGENDPQCYSADEAEEKIHALGEKLKRSSSYAGGLVDMEQAVTCWSYCVKLAGWSSKSYAHGVFDGADWIRRRFEEQFGGHGDWLVDFFHLGEYLAHASKSASLGNGWLSSAMSRTKRSELSETVATLRENLEDERVPDEEAPREECPSLHRKPRGSPRLCLGHRA